MIKKFYYPHVYSNGICDEIPGHVHGSICCSLKVQNILLSNLRNLKT